MNPANAYGTVKSAASDFVDDNAMTLGAALAFYSALSLAPLVMIFIAITALLGPQAQKGVIDQIESTVGPQAGGGVEQIIEGGRQKKQTGKLSTIIGFLVLLFSATGVFGQMQYSLNTIWEVQAKPGQGLWGWLRKRVLSFGMLLGIGFLLLVSLGLTAAINLIFAGATGWIWQAANFVVSLIVYIGLFMLIYKFLPDVKILWKDVWAGAVITTILFVIGKFLLGLYLGRGSVGSAYGAAGSLLVVLVWVYYASLIFFFGAEMTQTYAKTHGHKLEPEEHAEKIPEEASEKEEQPVA